MKNWSLLLRASILTPMLLIGLTHTTLADEPSVKTPSVTNDLPTNEKEFVEAINKFDKKQIVEKLGEPSKADDVKLKGTDKVVASIWHYHYLNTAADGSYYQTTELDFIDDKVMVVVFLNNDGEDGAEGGQKHDVPAATPDL